MASGSDCPQVLIAVGPGLEPLGQERSCNGIFLPQGRVLLLTLIVLKVRG